MQLFTPYSDKKVVLKIWKWDSLYVCVCVQHEEWLILITSACPHVINIRLSFSLHPIHFLYYCPFILSLVSANWETERYSPDAGRTGYCHGRGNMWPCVHTVASTISHMNTVPRYSTRGQFRDWPQVL